MCTLNHSMSQDVITSIEDLLLLRSHGVSRQPYGVRNGIFGGYHDGVVRMISNLASYFGDDKSAKIDFGGAHGIACFSGLPLIQGVGGLLLKSSSSNATFQASIVAASSAEGSTAVCYNCCAVGLSKCSGSSV